MAESPKLSPRDLHRPSLFALSNSPLRGAIQKSPSSPRLVGSSPKGSSINHAMLKLPPPLLLGDGSLNNSTNNSLQSTPAADIISDISSSFASDDRSPTDSVHSTISTPSSLFVDSLRRQVEISWGEPSRVESYSVQDWNYVSDVKEQILARHPSIEDMDRIRLFHAQTELANHLMLRECRLFNGDRASCPAHAPLFMRLDPLSSSLDPQAGPLHFIRPTGAQFVNSSIQHKRVSSTCSVASAGGSGLNSHCASTEDLNIDTSKAANIRLLNKAMRDAYQGLLNGHQPRLTEEGTGGTYYLRSGDGDRIVGVFKPEDEEFRAPFNPRGHTGRMFQQSNRAGILAGEGNLREVAAFIIDHGGHASVPATTRVEISVASFQESSYLPQSSASTPASSSSSSSSFSSSSSSSQTAAASSSGPASARVSPSSNAKSKVGSFQVFVQSDGMCSDFGASSFPVNQVHKLAILDIRLLNLDRNDGNILVRKNKPKREGDKGEIELIPIDHSYCLPDTLEICWADWVWMQWPQSKVPCDAATRDYIAQLDPVRDIELLSTALVIRPSCLRSLQLGTMLLQRGVAAGLSLFDIASIICRDNVEKPSSLEVMCAQSATFARSIHRDSISSNSKSANNNNNNGPAPLFNSSKQPDLGLSRSVSGNTLCQLVVPTAGFGVGTIGRNEYKNQRSRVFFATPPNPSTTPAASLPLTALRHPPSFFTASSEIDSSQSYHGGTDRKHEVQGPRLQTLTTSTAVSSTSLASADPSHFSLRSPLSTSTSPFSRTAGPSVTLPVFRPDVDHDEETQEALDQVDLREENDQVDLREEEEEDAIASFFPSSPSPKTSPKSTPRTSGLASASSSSSSSSSSSTSSSTSSSSGTAGSAAPPARSLQSLFVSPELSRFCSTVNIRSDLSKHDGGEGGGGRAWGNGGHSAGNASNKSRNMRDKVGGEADTMRDLNGGGGNSSDVGRSNDEVSETSIFFYYLSQFMDTQVKRQLAIAARRAALPIVPSSSSTFSSAPSSGSSSFFSSSTSSSSSSSSNQDPLTLPPAAEDIPVSFFPVPDVSSSSPLSPSSSLSSALSLANFSPSSSFLDKKVGDTTTTTSSTTIPVANNAFAPLSFGRPSVNGYIPPHLRKLQAATAQATQPAASKQNQKG